MSDRVEEPDESRESRVYLGKVEDVHSTHDGSRMARLVPLLRSDGSGDQWEGPVQDPPSEFPDRGVVFWWNVPSTVQKGSYWQFRTELHPTYAPPERPEKFQVISPVPPVEVIDVRHGWPEAKVRRAFTVEGVFLRDEPIISNVMIWFDKEHWVGPVVIERGAEPHVWRIGEREDLSRLEVYRVSTASLRAMKVDRRRLFLPPTLDRGQRLGFRNWMPDEKLASSLLARIRRLDQQVYEALGTTYRAFDDYQKVLESAGLEGHDLEQELARGKRVADLRTTIAANKALLEEAASILLSTPEVVREVESKKQQILTDVRKEQEEHLAKELEERRKALKERNEQLSSILHEINEATKRFHRLGEDIEAKEGRLAALSDKLESATSAFKMELAIRLKRLSESPEEAFAEVTVLRTLLGMTANAPTVQEPASLPPAAAEEQEHDDAGHVHVVTDSREAMKGIRIAFRRDGLPPSVGAHIHSAFLSGAVPIVAGARAYEALAAYASVTAGGRLTWIPISGAAFEPQDLLGRFDPATRTIVPHPAGLLNVLLEARGSDRIHVVILDGFNRAPVDSYLLPILQCHSDAWTGSRPRSLAIAPPGHVQGPSAYVDVSRVTWAANVLLAMIPATGAGMFPVPEMLWDHAILIDSDGLGYGASSTAPLESEAEQIPSSEIGADLWKRWRGSARSSEPGPVIEASKALADGEGLPLRAVRLAESVFAAARIFLSEPQALELAIKTSLLPRAHEMPSDRLNAVEGLGIQREEAEAILALAAKLAG
jgi:hypothetical protein